MNWDQTLDIYTKLGKALIKLSQNMDSGEYAESIQKALAQNAWFTKESVQLSLEALGNALVEEKIAKWLSIYSIIPKIKPKTIGLVMAGNIPLVGFHDMLCTLVSGNNVLAKLSSRDQELYRIIKDILVKIDLSFDSRIIFTDGQLKNIDAIIATGSNNSARYFEYYFSKYPHIIRKNRNSLAIITGDETFFELQLLGDDIFTFFGLGCRNVSFLMVPENYKFDTFFKALEKFNGVAHHNKYVNNYEYQKAIMMMNAIPLFDNGFVLLKEDSSLSSPIGVIHYTYYNAIKKVNDFIEDNKHKIQCVVSKTMFNFDTHRFGMAQQPELWDYADNIDTLEFLLKI